METEMLRETGQCRKCIWEGTLTGGDSAEMIVPDTQQDIREILCVQGEAFLRSKETPEGMLRMGGAVRATVLCRAEGDGGFFRMEAEIPVNAETECPGADFGCSLTASVHLVACEGKLIHSRKVLVRAEVLFCAVCRKEEELPLRLTPGEGCPAELRLEKKEILTAEGVSERSFVISEELELPENAPAEEIYFSETRLEQEEEKLAGTRLILKGTAYSTLVYATAEGQSPVTKTFSTPFTQIVELDIRTASQTETVLQLTGAYYTPEPSLSPGERTVRMELHITAQCTALEKKTLEYVTDAYLPGIPTEVVTEPFRTAGAREKETRLVHTEGKLSVMETYRELIYARVLPGKPEPMEENGEHYSVAVLNAWCLYLDAEGEVKSTSCKLTLREKTGSSEPDPASVCIPGEVKVTGGAEIRAGCALMLSQQEKTEETAVKAIRWKEEEKPDVSLLPSVLLRRRGSEDDLWTMAKECASTIRLILEANGAEDEASLLPGQMILIPRGI